MHKKVITPLRVKSQWSSQFEEASSCLHGVSNLYFVGDYPPGPETQVFETQEPKNPKSWGVCYTSTVSYNKDKAI